MSIGLIGTKLGMTREFIQSGQSVPVTVIKIETGRVIDIIEKDRNNKGFHLAKVEVASSNLVSRSIFCFFNSVNKLRLPLWGPT